MRIGVDTRELTGKKAGKGWYVYHVLKNILELDPSNEYILYCSCDIDFPKFKNATIITVQKPDLLWHFAVAKRLKKDKIDLYWAPTSPIVPALSQVPTVFTVHDLTNFLFPGMHTAKGRIIDKLFFGKAIAKSKSILSVSEATKVDLVKYFPESGKKTVVTPLGYDQAFHPIEALKTVEILSKYKLKPGYVLFVGTIEPRKNLEFLIDAYEDLEDNVKKNHPLVLVGKKGWLCENIMEKIKNSNVKYLDYAPFPDLPAIYNGCSLFVFPSIYEGFGMPPLEAMACGKPVIVSSSSSLPEVVGSAGIKVDPKNKKELTTKITLALKDNTYREKLGSDSLKQAAKFSWRETARKTLDTFK